MGGHLYPRVPDLRAAPTQELSDGELHYIIENGVPLTGMPAWRSPQPESADLLWKLVLYIRTLSPLTHQQQVLQANNYAQARYVGSKACAKCHAAIYERWKKTPMANVVRDPREHPDAILPNLATNTVWKFSRGQVALVYRDRRSSGHVRARAHVSVHFAGRDGQIRNPKPVHLMSREQADVVGYGYFARMDGALTLAALIKEAGSLLFPLHEGKGLVDPALRTR